MAHACEQARRFLREGSFAEAIACLRTHIASFPDDVEAQMELGLVELLAGHRERFAARVDGLQPRFSIHPPATPRQQSLWDQCRRVREAMTSAAALLTAAGLSATAAGCVTKAPPDPGPSVTVEAPATPPQPEPTAVRPTEPEAAPEEPVATPEPLPSASATEPDPEPYRPKTRYVAVRPNTIP
jgi:hypothetical protein